MTGIGAWKPLVGMTEERWGLLNRDDLAMLQPDEIAIGWHFCCEWDGLLIGPGMMEFEHCCACEVGGRCDA